MKKIILALATAAALSSTPASAFEAPGMFIKLEGGMQKLNNFKVNYKHLNLATAKVTGRNKAHPFLGIGIGSNIADNCRVDVTFSNYFDASFKDDVEVSISLGNGKLNNAAKTKLDKFMSIMVNGAFDIVDMGPAKLFVGGGIGSTILKKKDSVNNALLSSFVKDQLSKPTTTKKFSYALTAGVSTPAADNVVLELAYSWRDFGKHDSVRVQGHHLAAGVRFNF